jgi:hypothetical protein
MDDVQFQERGVQHRNKIKTVTGSQWLTVPVVQRRGQLINEVKIDSESQWQRKHWGALVTNYSPAPFFHQFEPELKILLLEKTYTDLSSLNIELIRWVWGILGIDIPIVYSSSLNAHGAKSELLVDICREVEAECYLSGPGGREYMDLAYFKTHGISVKFQEFVAPEYGQLFSKIGFIGNLSIVDVLFNCGPQAREFLR